MLTEMGELGDAEEIDAGICVVGAGPTGIALVRELREGRSSRIVLVESGGVEQDAGAARLNRGQDVGASSVGLLDGRARALGGTSRLWAGQCLPLDPLDFERRSWVPNSGWPLSRAELRPHLDRAARFFEVEGQPYDERVWSPFGLTPIPFDPAKLTHLATVYAPRPDLGSRFHRELGRAPGVQVLLRATAIRLDTDEGGRVATGLVVKGMDGRLARVRADTFVLCAGAIENARLLLLSNGVGNDADLVGRYLQDHPNAHVATLEAPSPEALLDRYSLLYRKPVRYFPKIGVAPELQRRREVLNGIANFIFDFGEGSGLEAAKRLYRSRRRGVGSSSVRRDLLRVGRDLPEIARAYRRYRRGLSPGGTPERIVLQAHTEQAPNRESRVRLGDETDPLGQPVARVEWRIGDQDVETARAVAGSVAEEATRLGLGRLRPAEWLDDPQAARGFGGAYHHLGTTRMSDDPRHGVVDRDCAVHGVAGLYCCGGSVFPAGGAANPTLTMVALAMRLADHLKAQKAGRRR